VDWLEPKGATFLEERRTISFYPGIAPVRAIIDWTSILKAVGNDLVLEGDPEHGGVQFRPPDGIQKTDTVYAYPKAEPKPHEDLDYPWVGESYTLNGHRYSIIDINHRENPRGTRFSAYRDYGRFGAFAALKIKAGESQRLSYRFVIVDGEMPGAAEIQNLADEYNGVTVPSSVPPLTTKPAEKS
jgi:hypothetical protein